VRLWAALGAASVVCAALALGRGARWQASRHETRLSELSTRELANLFLFIEPARLVRWSALGFLVVLLAALFMTRNVALAIGLAAGSWAVPFVAVRWLRKRRLERLLMQLPDALDAWAMSLRAGMAVNQTIAQLAHQQPVPIAQEFSVVSREQRVGRSLDEAMQSLAARVPLRECELLVTTVRIARETGGGLAEALDRLAATLRRKLAMESKIRALTAQGKIQGVIVAALPLMVMLALFWLQPQSMQPLLTTWAGWGTLAAIAVLEIVGYLLIRRIVNIEI
jgi:tight adherence protein B